MSNYDLGDPATYWERIKGDLPVVREFDPTLAVRGRGTERNYDIPAERGLDQGPLGPGMAFDPAVLSTLPDELLAQVAQRPDDVGHDARRELHRRYMNRGKLRGGMITGK